MIRSLGVVVRSNIPPNIRPPAPQKRIETEDDSDIEIIGQRGQCIDLDHSQSYSATFTTKQPEQFRIVDRVRIVNPKRPPPGDDPQRAKQYVDVDVMWYIQYRDVFGHLVIEKFRRPETVSGKQYVLERNIKQSIR
jgi:hypothetical protein